MAGFLEGAVLDSTRTYNGPKTAKVLRLMEDGSYQQAFEGPIAPSNALAALVYSKFDFTSGHRAALYIIEYADQRTAPFPISKDALCEHLAGQAWTITLRSRWTMSPFAKPTACGTALRTWMMAVWRPWWGAVRCSWNQATATDGKYKAADHIPDDVGGWVDAGVRPRGACAS